MRKLLLLLALLGASLAHAQNTVVASGNLKTMFGTAAASAKVKVCWTLLLSDGQQPSDPHVAGVGILVPTQTDCSTTVAADGSFSVTLYANDAIVTGGVANTTIWSVAYLYNGSYAHGAQYQFLIADVTENLNTKTPVNVSPSVTTVPTDGTYMRLDAGNSPATGPWQFNSITTLTSAKVTGGLGVNASPQTVTTSTISTPAFNVFRTDTSVPVSGAGIINGWLAPMVRFSLNSQGGGVTGSHNALLADMQSVKGKEWTTLTAGITLNASPQSVLVADSSIFTAGVDTAVIGFAQSDQENVAVTAVADSTHITGIFLNNHANGENITVSGGKGDKITAAFLMTEAAGNTNNLFAMNLNTVCVATAFHGCSIGEFDITNSAAAAKWPSQTGGPEVYGVNMIATGPFNTLFGWGAQASANGRFLTGFLSGGANDQGFLAINNGGGTPNYGFNAGSATTAGFICGAGQTAPADPTYTLANPTDCFFATPTATSGTVDSNLISQGALIAGVAHKFSWKHSASAAQMKLLYDGVEIFHIDSGQQAALGSICFSLSGNCAGSGNLRLPSVGSLAWRNNANNADVLLAKDTGDRLTYGGQLTPAVPSGFTPVDSTGLNAAVGTTMLYAVPANGAGQYRVSWDAKITTVAGVSSTLGSLVLTWTDPDGVVVSTTVAGQISGGTVATTATSNITGTVLLGLPVLLNCKASTNIQYAMGYVSNAGGAMIYNLHIKLESM